VFVMLYAERAQAHLLQELESDSGV
jgi:hypothetical protein